MLSSMMGLFRKEHAKFMPLSRPLSRKAQSKEGQEAVTNNREQKTGECAGHYTPICGGCGDCRPNYKSNDFPTNYDCPYFRKYEPPQKS